MLGPERALHAASLREFHPVQIARGVRHLASAMPKIVTVTYSGRVIGIERDSTLRTVPGVAGSKANPARSDQTAKRHGVNHQTHDGPRSTRPRCAQEGRGPKLRRWPQQDRASTRSLLRGRC